MMFTPTLTMIVLFVLGFALILAELLLPGLVLGICGFISIITATIMAFHTFGTEVGFYVLLGELILFIAGFILWIRYFPKSAIGKLFSLPSSAPLQASSSDKYQNLPGKAGRTLTPLHPTGIALIENERYDVVSEGNPIEENREITVVYVEGARIVVRLNNPQ